MQKFHGLLARCEMRNLSDKIDVIDQVLTYGSKHSNVVILEGIMYADWYKPVFEFESIVIEIFNTVLNG